MTDNIVKFPDAEDLFINLLENLNPVVNDIIDTAMTTMLAYGYDVANPDCSPEYVVLVESLFNLLLKSKGEN